MFEQAFRNIDGLEQDKAAEPTGDLCLHLRFDDGYSLIFKNTCTVMDAAIPVFPTKRAGP